MRLVLLPFALLFVLVTTVKQAYSASDTIDFFNRYWENYDCRGGASRSFLFTHPAQSNQFIRRSGGWHRVVNNRPEACGSIAQGSMVYQSSDPVKTDARKFFWGCNDELLITGDRAPNVAQRNVRAEWLNIDDPEFRGVLTITPENSQVGAIVDINILIGQYIDFPVFQDYWMTISLPVFSVKTSLNPTATNVAGSRLYAPEELILAFNQTDWQYGKITNQRSAAGLSAIDFRFGRTYWGENGFEFSYYSGVSVPTARGQLAEFLFDAYIGNNGHFAFISGVTMQLPLNLDDACTKYCWFINLENVYLLRNTQTRTMDLYEKPWSRYLLLNKKDGPPDQKIPAVNVLSQQVRVRPFDQVDFISGVRIISPSSEVEAGWGIWGHGDERIRLNCEFPQIFGIAGRSASIESSSCPSTYPPTATSASKSTIACQAEDDEEFVTIKISDLDIKTPAAKKAIVHRFFASFSYLNNYSHFAGFITAGTYYEFPQSENGALTYGGVWVKGGATF